MGVSSRLEAAAFGMGECEVSPGREGASRLASLARK